MSRHQKSRRPQAPRGTVALGTQDGAAPASGQGQAARGDDGEAFEQIRSRLDDIVSEVRAKDVSLERSLDLLDEAVRLGSRAVELVDTTALSDSEKQRLAADEPGQDAAEADAAGDASPAEAGTQDGEAASGGAPDAGTAAPAGD